MEVLNSGYLSIGPKIKKFEKKFAEKIGTKYACAVSSGTAGLHLALLAAGIKDGDEVITTPFSFVASSNTILYVGAKPVFVDVDPLTFNINPGKIEKKITRKTKAILVVHIFGQAADMSPILRLAKKYHLKIVEDACEAIYATYKKRRVGTFGESAVFAFYPNKQMTTGEGGMITTNKKSVYEICSSLKNQGRAPDMQWLDHKYLGYNYRMDEMSAALGLAQLEKLKFLIKERAKIAALYDKHLKPFKNKVNTPYTATHNTNTWYIYSVLLNKAVKRNTVIKKLAEAGIASKPYLPSIHSINFYKDLFGYKKGDFPVSEDISARSLALPLYIGLKEKDVKYIVDSLLSIIK